MKKLLLPFTILQFVFTANLFSQNLNITLAGQLSYGMQELSNIWGWKSPVDGKEYALVGAANGLSIVDVSNPFTPVQITQIPGPVSQWREIRTNGNYAYVTTESGSIGLQIVDLINLPSATLAVATWKPLIGIDSLETIHALQIDNGKVYLYGSNVGGGGAVVADINTTPMSPVYLGSYDAGGYIHDGYVRNDTMYAGHIWAGTVEVVNMANPANGIPLASFQTPGAFTHNTWLSQNSKYCFTTDEVSGAYLAAFDISNLANILLTDSIRSNPGSGSIVHNTYIINKSGIDYAVTSWYKDGITVVDASNPSNLVQVGNYDTSPLSGGGFAGCWGVYPYLPSGIILASDIELGLFVLNSVHLTSAVNENTVENLKVNVYPNPSNGMFNVQWLMANGNTSHPAGGHPLGETINHSRRDSFGATTLTIEVYNVLGEKVYSRAVPINNERLTINLSSQPSGMYFYKVVPIGIGKEIAAGKLLLE